jgi:hypothetical protein
MPIFPIALFSYDRPLKIAENQFEIEVFETPILRFQFQAIQLNRLNWREFINQPNPVASALMAKMNIAVEDRVRVKIECLRMIATLRLDPARTTVIGVFMESYLTLTELEEVVYNQQIEAAESRIKEILMDVDYKAVLEEIGMARGSAKTIVRQLRRRFGAIPVELSEEIRGMTSDKLDQLGDALLDFKSVDDAQAWVSNSRLA